MQRRLRRRWADHCCCVCCVECVVGGTAEHRGSIHVASPSASDVPADCHACSDACFDACSVCSLPAPVSTGWRGFTSFLHRARDCARSRTNFENLVWVNKKGRASRRALRDIHPRAPGPSVGPASGCVGNVCRRSSRSCPGSLRLPPGARTRCIGCQCSSFGYAVVMVPSGRDRRHVLRASGAGRVSPIHFYGA